MENRTGAAERVGIGTRDRDTGDLRRHLVERLAQRGGTGSLVTRFQMLWKRSDWPDFGGTRIRRAEQKLLVSLHDRPELARVSRQRGQLRPGVALLADAENAADPSRVPIWNGASLSGGHCSQNKTASSSPRSVVAACFRCSV